VTDSLIEQPEGPAKTRQFIATCTFFRLTPFLTSSLKFNKQCLTAMAGSPAECEPMFAASEGGADRGRRAKSKGPAWMGTGVGKGPKKSDPQWKPTAPQQHDPEARQRAIRAIVSLAAAVLLGGFIYSVLTRPEATPLIVLRAAPYPLQMPPLAFAEEDAELLSQISPQNVKVMPVALESRDGSLDEFRKTISAAGKQFNPLRRGANAVFIYIAAHGVVDERGRACLVPPSANPFDSQTWLPLASVLQVVRDDPGLKDRDKLVLLDCQRVYSCWRCGWLENRFFDELASDVKAQADPRMYVISAAGPRELAWAAPELRGSTFGYFLARGLRGEASPTGRAVSVTDLYRYVATQVSSYSHRRRGIAQQPVLLHREDLYRPNSDGLVTTAQGKTPPQDNVLLCYVDRWQSRRKLAELQSSFDPLSDFKKTFGQTNSSPAKPEAAAAGQSLLQLWALYRHRREGTQADSDEPAALPGYSLDPVAWSSVQQRLSAIGERLLAGKQYQGPALQMEIDKLAKDLGDEQQWASEGGLPKLSLPPPDGLERTTPGTGTSGNVFAAYSQAEPDKRTETIPRGVSRARVVRDIYAELTSQTPPDQVRPRLDLAVELLERVPRADASVDFVEGHFVNLLQRGLPLDQPLSHEQLAAALEGRQAAERAARPLDLRIHYALEPLVNPADEQRRQAEDAIFVGGESGSVQRPSSPGGEAQSAPSYEAALRQGQRLTEFLRLRDEIWSELPLLAEWHIVRARQAGGSPPARRLALVLQQAIELDDGVERVLRARDEPTAFVTPFDRCEKIYSDLEPVWRALRADLQSVYERPTNVQQAYRRPEDLRDTEIAIRWPPMKGNFNQFLERYLQTLVDTEMAAPSGPPVVKSASAVDPGEHNEFLRELHRALDYEFIVPYEQHRQITPWEGAHPPADLIFRSGEAGREPAWIRLGGLLNRYKDAISSENPAWNRSQRAYASSARLRQWDRRVRVAGPWLACFQADLKWPNQPTPARWLQEFDAAHFTAWQAYRAAGDFWGNGEADATSGTPYFAAAIGQCDAVLPGRLRPIQYDVPGGELADFSEQSPAALQALRAWDPVQFPRSFSASSGPDSGARIEVAIQPATDSKILRLPQGTATLSFVSSAAAPQPDVRVAFDLAGQRRTEAVKLPLADASPLTATAYVQRPASPTGTSEPLRLDARLWYRGHIRSKPSPLGDLKSQYVEYEFSRSRYPPPTIEVRGKDTIRGAVLFVFDCSRSMQGGGFALAQSQLTSVLDQLQREAGDALNVGLLAYGSQTDASANYYADDSRRNSQGGLSPRGQQEQARDPAFTAKHPHPDGDVSTLVPLQGGKTSAVLAAVRAMREQDCIGVTPLYFATTKAIETVLRDAGNQPARRIVVISDGVNMPYNTGGSPRTNYSLGRTGTLVNQEDYRALEEALTRSQGSVHVTVQLFGSRNTNFEAEQYRILKRLDELHDNFEVFEVDPKLIAESIRKSFPKAQIELRGDKPTATLQQLAFNQSQDVRDWGGEGSLRRELERRWLRLKLPGEDRSLEKSLDLLGGERVVLAYNAGEARLTFEDDGLTWRGSGQANAPRATDSLKLVFDALDPERLGTTIRRFRFRIRDEDRAERLAPRPTHVWLEIKPRGITVEAADLLFPCLDAAWMHNSVNLPRMEVPVERWPDCPSARVQAWFRYSDPATLRTATVPRDSTGQTLTIDRDEWRIVQVRGESPQARKIAVIWRPSQPQPGVERLLDRAVWLSPAPDHTRRRYAVDGTEAVHEFTYTQPDLMTRDIQVSVVTRAQFQQGAYSAECEFDVAN
jgi:hypothetical protein